MTRPVYDNLLSRFHPKPQQGGVGRGGTFRECSYARQEGQQIPQLHHVIQPEDCPETLVTVDLMYPLPYELMWREIDAKTERILQANSEMYHVPLLIEVRPDPITIEPEIATFNIIRDIITRRFDNTMKFYDLLDNECLLVTRRSLSRYEQEMLVNANIHHYRLGPSFDTFWREEWLGLKDESTTLEEPDNGSYL